MFRYILLDSSQHLRFHQKLQQWNAMYRSLFEGHAEETLPEIAPLLIDVTIDNEATRQVIDETMRIGVLKPCVSILESTLPLVLLAKHFAQFHLVETSEGRSLLMRWYDTRILPVWFEVLTEEQRGLFAHPIMRWVYIDRFGNEQQQDLPHDDVDTPLTSRTSLRLDVRQVEQLFTAAEPDGLIFALRKALRPELDRIPYHVLYPFMRDHWQMARQQGLHDQSNHILFLMLALYTSGRFVEHPTVTEWLISQPKPLEQEFVDWFKALPENLWELGATLWKCPGHVASEI
jgi:hypothetical protein